MLRIIFKHIVIPSLELHEESKTLVAVRMFKTKTCLATDDAILDYQAKAGCGHRSYCTLTTETAVPYCPTLHQIMPEQRL